MEKEQKTYEFDGRTVEEAIENALSELDVSRESIQVKVVSEEKKGLFGREGAKRAKIMVTLKENDKNS